MMGAQLAMDKINRPVKADQLLVALVLLFTGIGLAALYSASYAHAARFKGNGLYYISRQAALAILSLFLFFVVSRANLELVRKWISPIVIGTIFLCALTFVPGIGVAKNGAARWIGVGNSTYQPSELVKAVLPFYLAHIFDKKNERFDSFSAGVLPPTMITVIFFVLIYMQNNFSTAFFVLVNALVVFFLAGIRLRFFFAAAMIFLPLSVFFVLTREHRLRRFISFLWPEYDPQGAGYQVKSSIITIASGGFWGKGLGHGTRKISSVPEVHSDFIFASFAEEGGFFAVGIFFVLLALFAFAAYRCAFRSSTSFRRLLCFGIGTMIVSQSLLNIAVVVGALPATGIPLPFFSAGGSSLTATLLMCGLLINTSREAVYV
ncbi:MAG: putative lipid II flippase FtsW [Spirochaetaceae bacterium]|jgi:cell division protein FtsW|nr:putative lipid II flippase FtsW [Spirochaetaceae bacterium]